jgi:type I site-specific restriction endonuclease
LPGCAPRWRRLGSDEAHRSINGNSHAVFEYFIGYKLGLIATANPDWTFYEADTAQVSVYALAIMHPNA